MIIKFDVIADCRDEFIVALLSSGYGVKITETGDLLVRVSGSALDLQANYAAAHEARS